MDGVAVGLRRVGRKFTRPGLVKGLSPVKAYAKSYGTRPPLSKRQVDLGSGLAKEHAEFAAHQNAPQDPPALSRSHSGSTEPSARETSRAARFNARSKPGPVPCGGHPQRPPEPPPRSDATAAPPTQPQSLKQAQRARNEPRRAF